MSVGERDYLSVAEDRECSSCSREELEHLGQRPDRRDAAPESDERAGQLPGLRAEVDDIAGLLFHERAKRRLRIAGTTALVGTRDLGERRRTPAPLVAMHNHRRSVRALLLGSLGQVAESRHR